MAAAELEYPLMFDSDGYLIWNQNKLEDHLIHELEYTQTDASRLTSKFFELSVNQEWMIVMGEQFPHIPLHIKSVDKEEFSRSINIWRIIKNYDLFKIILYSLSIANRMKLLRSEFVGGMFQITSVLREISVSRDPNLMKIALESIGEDQHYDLLSVKKTFEQTPIHYGCVFGDSNLLEAIKMQTSQETWFKLLQVTNDSGYTPLHYAAEHPRNIQNIKIIADSLPAHQLIKLLKITDLGGQTPLQKISADGSQKSVLLLQDYQTKALIEMALQQTDETERMKLVIEIIEHEPLSMNQIKTLAVISDRHIIPFNMNGIRPHAMILYNQDSRPGADDEATMLEESLKATRCVTRKLKWNNASDIFRKIDSAFVNIDGECSLLILCIMSHGYKGFVTGTDRSETALDTIQHQLKHNLPDYVPLMIILQACQEDITQDTTKPGAENEPQRDPAVYKPNDKVDIQITRPNTVFLSATIDGSVAYRGVFTGTIADEFSKADGKTDVNTMFERASAATEKILSAASAANIIYEQVPIYRSTLRKSLILPPVLVG